MPDHAADYNPPHYLAMNRSVAADGMVRMEDCNLKKVGMTMMKYIGVYDDSGISVHGRIVRDGEAAVLTWTGSFVEIFVKATELYIDIEGPYELHENWIAVEIDGELFARQLLPKERTRICLFRNVNPDKVTRVRVIKEVQAMSMDSMHCLRVYGFETDGETAAAADYYTRYGGSADKLKIEFIGDSVTSGEGTYGARPEEEWISMYFGHTRSYPYYVSKALDADYRIVSQSGWGVYSSWDNMVSCNIPDHYEEVCSVLIREKEDSACSECDTDSSDIGAADSGSVCSPTGFGAPFFENYDFEAWKPDFIVCNLGTNDDGAFHNPGFTDPVTGEYHKLRMDSEDGISGSVYNPDDLATVRNAVYEFMKKLRRCNPGAYIIWAFGILGDSLRPAIEGGITDFVEETGDGRAMYLPITNTNGDTVGSRMHPGVKAHLIAADEIMSCIREHM